MERGLELQDNSSLIDNLFRIRPLGFHFANHTLRRTFGRRLFHAEVPVETIFIFLGYGSTTETLKYIGVNLDDMDAGMAKLAQYDRKRTV